MQRTRHATLIAEITEKLYLSDEYANIPVNAAKIMVIRDHISDLGLSAGGINALISTLNPAQLCAIYFELTKYDCFEPAREEKFEFLKDLDRDMKDIEYKDDTHDEAKLRAVAGLTENDGTRKLTSGQANTILGVLGFDNLVMLRDLI
jgi:hypothetical protein